MSARSVIAPATTIVVASFALLFSVIRVSMNVVSVINPDAFVSEFDSAYDVPARWLIPGVVGLLGWVAVIGLAIMAMVTDGRIRRGASCALAGVAALLFVLLFAGVLPGSSHELLSAALVLLLSATAVVAALGPASREPHPLADRRTG